ncbi:hypothetical protein [Rosistilla oblonga]|uniref:hypothetical protein n=1 Tax=Rosistilla oblonga TaxID=2527990 RepID=UPI003A96D62A
MFRFFILSWFILMSLPVSATPGNRDLNASLSAHGLNPDSKTLVAKCESLWKSHVDDLHKVNAARLANKIDDVSHQIIAKLCFAGRDIRFYADELIDMGEPAGLELRLRGDALWNEAHRASLAYLPTERGKKLTMAAMKALTKGQPGRQREVQKISDQVSKGNLDAAANAFQAAEEDLWKEMLWIHHTQRPPFHKSFQELQQTFWNAWRSERKAANAENLKKILASQTPDLAAVSGQLTEAIASIGQTGSCQIDGSSATGPEAFRHFFEKWQSAHVGLIRCQGIYWALQTIGAAPNQGHGPWSETAAEWNTKMLAMLPELIVADASHATGNTAAGLYMQYLQKIAPLARRTPSSQLAAAVEPPLAQLLSSTPQAAALVDRYQRATNDMLTWRARLAAAQAKQRNESFPSLANQFAKANQSFDSYLGLFEKPANQASTPTLRIVSPELLTVPVEKLLETQVRAADLTRIPGGGRFSLSAYRDRAFANVPATIDLAAPLADLQSDLLVSDTQPPLSLRAAMALESAKQIDMRAIGGTIKNLYLESVIVRFASLPTAAAVLFPLSGLPSDGESQQRPLGMDQMMMRFDVMPSWVWHDYFVADLGN